MKLIKIIAGSALFITSSICSAELTTEQEQWIQIAVENALNAKLTELGLDQANIQSTIGNHAQEYEIAKQEELERVREQLAVDRAKLMRPVDDTDHIRGNLDAEFTLVEYSDYLCPYCARFHQTAKEFLDSNKVEVNWAYRHYPLSFHDPVATEQAEIAECVSKYAGSEKFWEFTDTIYTKGVKELTALLPLVDGLNLTIDQTFSVKTCWKENELAHLVKEDIADGSTAGISGTPGNILVHNATGELVVIAGAMPLNAVQNALNELKAKVNNQLK